MASGDPGGLEPSPGCDDLPRRWEDRRRERVLLPTPELYRECAGAAENSPGMSDGPFPPLRWFPTREPRCFSPLLLLLLSPPREGGLTAWGCPRHPGARGAPPRRRNRRPYRDRRPCHSPRSRGLLNFGGGPAPGVSQPRAGPGRAAVPGEAGLHPRCPCPRPGGVCVTAPGTPRRRFM